MIICYSGCSAPSARKIAEQGDFQLNRGSRGHANWGRYRADTELNPDISTSTNKRIMRELFKEHGVPMPKLLDIHDGFNQWPIVGRSERHTKGRGFWLCHNIHDVEKALKGTRRKKPATHFMEYIEAPREYRVHIFKGLSIRISEKAFSGSNKHNYITTKPQHPIAHVRRAAKQAVEALGLDFGAVDILANEMQAWVLEVNAAPGCGGSVPQLYADVFKRWEHYEHR